MWDQVQKKIKKATNVIVSSIYSQISSVIKEENSVYIQLSEDEEIRDVRIITPFGFYSLPNTQMFGQVIFNNSAKKAVIIGVEDEGQKPVELNIGEVLIYRPGGGTSYIHFKNDDKIYIKGEIILSDGVKPVARVDDTIEVVVDGVTYTGKITSGSENIKG